MDDAAPRANRASGFNHAARRAYAPSEYRPTTRIQRRVMENHNRKAYWCHLCYTSRLDSKGLNHHYDQAHPAQVRDESSRMYTTYNDSRHGRLDEQRHAERPSPTDVFATLRYGGSKRDRPTAQLRPVRSQYANPSAVGLIPQLLQPPPSALTLSGYHTIKSLACAPPRRAGMEMMQMSPDSLSRKRRRLSPFKTQHTDWALRGSGNGGCFGEGASEDGDGDEDGNGDIPHEPSSVSMWDKLDMGRVNAQPRPNPSERIANADANELSPNATRALEAGAGYEGEAQDRSTSYTGVDTDGDGDGDDDDNDDIDPATPSEAVSRGAEPSAMEILVRRMFVKQAELEDLMVEMMELVNGSRSFVE